MTIKRYFVVRATMVGRKERVVALNIVIVSMQQLQRRLGLHDKRSIHLKLIVVS